MRIDGRLQVAHLLAGQRADRAKRRQVPLGTGDVARRQISLSDVFVGAAVARVDRQRTFVVNEGLSSVPNFRYV